jgi:ankyrin repeat protein
MPIHRAAEHDATNVFDLLYEFVASDARTDTEAICLFIAAANGSKSIVDRILTHPHQRQVLQSKGMFGVLAFVAALEYYRPECVRLLLRHVDPREGNSSPFQHLFRRWKPKEDNDAEKLIETLGVLLEDERIDVNAAVGSDETTPLGLAKSVERAQRLLLEDPRIDLARPIRKDGPTGFFVALNLGVWSAVRRYIPEHKLPEGLRADDQGNTVLHLLTKPNAPTDLLEAQIGQATSEQLNAVNKRGQTPFTRALSARNWNLASRMIDTGRLSLGTAERGFQGELFVALQHDAPDVLLRKMVASTPDLFCKADRSGWTILHHIAAHDHKDWAKRIMPLVNDASPWSLADSLGRRPVDLAGDTIRSMASAHTDTIALPNGRNWDANAGWHRVDRKSARIFVQRAKEASKKADRTGVVRGWIVERGSLSFYPGSGIFKIRAASWEHHNRAFYFLAKNGEEIVHLNGTSPPIHIFNAKYGLSLNADNVLDYLRFFCFFVRGEEGPFFILDHVDEAIFDATMSSADRAALAALAHPAWVIAKTEDGFEAVAHVFYSNVLFGAYFSIKSTGMIEMRDDFPLLADLSGAIDMPLT